MHLDYKSDQIVWVLCAWGKCCNEAGKHWEKLLPLSEICTMPGSEMERREPFPLDIILC